MRANDKRPGLSRQTLVETGLRLLDEVGLDGLTVRRLAAELGVQSPALYWHVRTKQELLDAMGDEIIRAAGMGPPREEESWQDWLDRRARAYRASLLSHRDGARIVAGARGRSPVTLRLFEEELSAMVARGFTPALALHTITALSHYVIGSVLQQQTEPERPAVAADATEDDIPAILLAAVRDGGGPFGERAFDHGLRAFIDGTAAALARRNAASPS
ncbi:TetR/AcrR family transcriptional regulator C-terminal domain-containing protein [Sphaerisporangium rhizosphaerae]|uniref:TetR/AcrR family transcriptional regulator C-terminal domain-containing protein n=1 Tax=Sphaerisporangium rhizosphaerae TaxID=2269375 RepID=A0ABW2P179_9ACTN